MNWTQFYELAQSTGYVFFLVLMLWFLLGAILYWAIASGTTSMKEEIKLQFVEDDKPISR